jgi:protein-S-isoprenylcysteine O-methyltransferase Ste14
MFSERFIITNIILTSIALILLAIAIFRKVAKDYQKLGKLSITSTILEFVLFFLHGLSSYIFLEGNWSKINYQNPLPLMGIILLIFGIVLSLLSMSRLGFKKSLGQEVSTLQKNSFYKYTRNPQLVFYSMVIVGYALLWPSWIGAIWILLYFSIAGMMVRTEEKHLLDKFGKVYQIYCEKTPRYFRLPGSLKQNKI